MQSPTGISIRIRARLLALALAALAATLAAAFAAHEATGAGAKKNVIFILTDDMTTSQLAGMPNVQSQLVAQGVSFNKYYVSFPLCCPSRATMLTGRYMHNHGVRGNVPPNGSWLRYRPLENDDLPVWLKRYGYYNIHVGKYMNFYATETGDLPVPAGWDEWYGKVSQDALYFNYELIEKAGPAVTPHITFYGDQPSDYQTDVFSDRADDFVNELDPARQTPFLLNLWFNSPHGPFDPAPRDLYKLASAPLPRLPAFNEKDIRDKPKWLRKQIRRPLTRSQIALLANERRRQQEQLLSVDQAVGDLISSLRSRGLLDDTYIVFTSDNGFFRGEHRLASGKYLPYDPASRLPMVIRGPGIPPGGVSNEVVWNGDIPQTILQIASGNEDPRLDGRSLLPYAMDPAKRSTRPVLLEADTGPGAAGAENATASAARARAADVGVADRRGVENLEQETDAIKSASETNNAPAYRSIRTDRYELTVYSNGQSELYDMKRDPAQLRNVIRDPRYRLVKRFLLRNLAPLAGCAGDGCRVEIGPDPAPRKTTAKGRGGRKPKGGGKPKPGGKKPGDKGGK